MKLAFAFALLVVALSVSNVASEYRRAQTQANLDKTTRDLSLANADADEAFGKLQALDEGMSSTQRSALSATTEAAATKQMLADATVENQQLKAERDAAIAAHAATCKLTDQAIADLKKQATDAAFEKQQLEQKLDAKTAEVNTANAALVVFTQKLEKAATISADNKAQLERLEKEMAALPKPAAQPKPQPTARASNSDKLNAAIDTARATNRKVVIVFRQTICGPCNQFEAAVLNQSSYVLRASPRFETVVVNIDEDEVTANQFHVPRTPWVVVYEPNSSLSTAKVNPGFVPTARVDAFLNQVQ